LTEPVQLPNTLLLAWKSALEGDLDAFVTRADKLALVNELIRARSKLKLIGKHLNDYADHPVVKMISKEML
jgi:hypothetical protein